MEIKVDCRGLSCPIPVVNTKNAYEKIDYGEITCIVDNNIAKENVKKLANKLNSNPIIEKINDDYYITLHKEKDNSKKTNSISKENRLVVVISKDKLGEGDERLGKILIKGYIHTLLEVDIKPKTIIFINSGVKLLCKGSDSISDLLDLHKSNIEILACGTCLDYYNIKEKILIGEISNMYTIVDEINSASNTYMI